MNSLHIQPSRIGNDKQAYSQPGLAHVPLDLDNSVLRQAVQENLVSFPSQVPVFEKHSRPDLQHKIVVLYFVLGWTMDDIAKRYGLGRQRVGQILTTWRIRAVRDGYVQAIEPEHPSLQKETLEQTKQHAELAAGLNSVADGTSKTTAPPSAAETLPEPEAEQTQPAKASITALNGANLEEELQAIVGVLDNQLRLCSDPLNARIDSCEQLLARAKVLCARLEARGEVAASDVEKRIAVVISGAKQLFRRFQEHAEERSSNSSKSVFGLAGKSKPARRVPSVNNSHSLPPRRSQRVAVGV